MIMIDKGRLTIDKIQNRPERLDREVATKLNSQQNQNYLYWKYIKIKNTLGRFIIQ